MEGAVNTYEFTLKFKLPDAATDMDALVERLGAAGCNDAVLGVGRPGRIALTFDREARTADEAVRCALQDVTTAIPDATLVEASPDFVGLTDIADMIGVTRQNLRKLSLAQGARILWHYLKPSLSANARSKRVRCRAGR